MPDPFGTGSWNISHHVFALVSILLLLPYIATQNGHQRGYQSGDLASSMGLVLWTWDLYLTASVMSASNAMDVSKGF